MPGTAKAAVVLLWVLFGFGVCGGVVAAVVILTLSTLDTQVDIVFPSWYMPFLVAVILHMTIWTVLRGVFAVKIAKRSASARTGAIILELVGVALGIASWILTPQLDVAAAGAESNTAGTMANAIIGIAIALVIVGLLSTQDSKRWCDR
jgi:hypothetical protein